MSLNKIQINGLVGSGLDIECKSINTSFGGSSLIRGVLTVEGIADLQGDVTCESSLTVVGNTDFFGRTLLHRPLTSFSGVLPTQNISVSDLVNGIVILQSDLTSNLILPSSETLDIFLDNPSDGTNFHCSFINKSLAGEIQISSAEIPANQISAPSSATASSQTDKYFYKIFGVWILIT